MRRRRSTSYFIGFFVVWLCVGAVGFLAGYLYSTGRAGEDPPTHIVEENPYQENNATDNIGESNIGNRDIDERPVASQRVVINEETKIVYRIRYERCQTELDEVREPFDEMLGLNNVESSQFIKANFEGWNQISFSGDEVVLSQSKDQYCPKHFWVSQVDGYIAIYQFQEDGSKTLVEKTQIPISTLPSMDQENLKTGFPLPSREDVDKLLEDYSG